MSRISLALTCALCLQLLAVTVRASGSGLDPGMNTGHALAPLQAPATDPVCQFSVSFADNPETAGLSFAERELIALHVMEAGQRWTEPLQLADSCGIEVLVRLDPDVATANAASLTSVFVAVSGERSMYEQGVAHELRTGIDPNGSSPDMNLVFGAAYFDTELWFDPDPQLRIASVPKSRIDAFSVVLHEMGHGIAYSGWADGQGNAPPEFYSVFDRWMLPGTPALFDGPNAVAAWGSQPELTLDNINHWGNSSSGFDIPEQPAHEIRWQGGVPLPTMTCDTLHPAKTPQSAEPPLALLPSLLDQLMNGVAFYYQHRYYISSLDIAVLRDVGLPLRDLVFEDGFENPGD